MLANALRTSALFAREWVGRPAAVGAICPSSKRLAMQIASQMPAGDSMFHD
jgi:phospholipid N-methyltransferase